MLGILRDRHMEITEDLPQADIIIVNTCTFIEKAKQESIDTILQLPATRRRGNARYSSSRAAWASSIKKI